MKPGLRFSALPVIFIAGASIYQQTAVRAELVPVHHAQGLLHGFLLLRSLEGSILATGEVTQVANGIKVTNELVFNFKDGSRHQETTVFSQRRTFRLLNYRLVQKGPVFKQPVDLSLNNSTGETSVRYMDDGKEKTITERKKLPDDVANGLVTVMLNDIDPKASKTTVSMVATTPKPRLVKLVITPEGEGSFSIGGATHKAARYVIKVDIGGISGVIAPIIGKQPPDTHVWVMAGKAPSFLKSEGPLFEGGPIWRIELASPVWSKSDVDQKR